MRKIITLLGLLCLMPASAWAEDYVTLAELRSQAESGWHETMTAMGREVVVQADITWFPGEEACPVLEVSGAVKAQPGKEFTKTGNGKVRDSDSHVAWYWCKESPFIERSERSSHTPVSYTVYGGQEPMLIPQGLDIGYQELLAQINADLAPYTSLTLADFRIEAVQVEGISYNLEGENSDGTLILGSPRSTTGEYHLEAMQLLRGIPLVEPLISGGNIKGKLRYDYYSRGWRYYYLYCAKENGVLHKDVPLLSFDAMKQVWISQIQEGKLRGIDELEFGYLICKSGKQLVTLPVWRLKGGYTTDPKRKNVMPYQDQRDKDGSLTVPLTYTDYFYHAQTGEMLSACENGVWELPRSGIQTWKDVR